MLCSTSAGSLSRSRLFFCILPLRGMRIVNVVMSRSLVGLKSAGSREETKKVVFEYVKKEVGDAFSWPLKRNKNGYADECYDMADSYVIARAAVIEDCVDAIWEDWRMEEAIHKSVCLSPVFSDFCKVNLAYHLRKHMSEKIGTLDDLSPELVEVPFVVSESAVDLFKETPIVDRGGRFPILYGNVVFPRYTAILFALLRRRRVLLYHVLCWLYLLERSHSLFS